MSSINVDTLKSRLGGPPTLPSGVVVSAAATFNNDVSIGGTLTYEDVTNVDVVGLITARSGIKFGIAGVGGTIDGVGNAILSGITTVGTALSFADNVRAKFGNAGDLEIFHTGSESHILEQGTGGLILNSNVTTIKNAGDSETIARFTENGGVDLNFDNSTKFATHNTGVKVTGIATISSDLNVAGITTVGILTAYESITVKVGAGSTELTSAIKTNTTNIATKASTGKAIAMAMVFG